jgi:YihY family inner membrane protein
VEGWAEAVGVGAVVLLGSWGLLVLVAVRLPAGVLKDLAGFLPACVTAVRRLRKDPRVPRRAKVVVLLAGLWVLSPIDLIPELLPVIGPLDDVVVVALAFRYAARRVPRDALFDAWPGEPALLERLLTPRPRPDWGTVARRFREERTTLTAAGVAFYAFLSLVPALGASVSVYGLFVGRAQVDDHVRRAFAVLPGDAQDLLVDQLQRIVERSSGQLGLSFGLAVLVALWSASKGVTHLLDAIGTAYGTGRRAGFLRRRAVAAACTLGALAVGAGAATALTVLPRHFPAGPTRWFVYVALWAGLAVVGLGGLAGLYRLGAGATGAWFAPGTTLALALLVLLTVGLHVYVANFGSYDATYGALAGVVVLLLWLHLVALIVIAGAQVNAGTPTRPPPTA